MEKKLIYFGIFVFAVFISTSCSEGSNKARPEKSSETKIVEVDTSKTGIADTINCQTEGEIEALKDAVEQPVKKTVKKDVFKIYKNGVRQNLVIAWTPTPDEASEDWVWFVNDIDKYFNGTHPVENLMYFNCPPDGISNQDMENFAKELGYDEPYAGYYLIDNEGKKDFIQHDLVSEVISGIYTFFNIEGPIEE